MSDIVKRSDAAGEVSRRDFLQVSGEAGLAVLLSGLEMGTEAVSTDLPVQNGRKVPQWFAYRCPYQRFDAETLKAFRGIGVDVVCISPLNTLCLLGVPYSPYPSTWIGPGQYDFKPLDQYIADVRAVNPNARLMCVIDLNTPDWLARREQVDSFTELGRIIANERWRAETRNYLQAFLKHAESHYADIIVAYLLACGMTLEWQDGSLGQESPTRRAAWRKWMTQNGMPDPVDIPPASVREHVSHGVFRDPVADATAINYWKFLHWQEGETILYFVAGAQEVLKHRVPLGIFYGYMFEHAAGRLLYEGHLDFDRLYSSPNIDWIVAPGTYYDRGIGGASGFMVCLHSLKHHGKGFIQEIDHRTHTCQSGTILGRPIPGYGSGFPDRSATIAGLRREFALALINGISLWWFNIFGHLYDDPEVVKAIGQMRELWDSLNDHGDKPVAEVALLADAESMIYIDGKSPVVTDLLHNQRYGLGRMGTPYEVYSFADLPTLDLSRHKLIFLPNLFVVDEKKRKWLKEKVCVAGKTVIWGYAPGIITDGRYDPANVERLTGIAYGTKNIAERSMDGWRSVFAPTPNLSAAVLRQLVKKAGVHIYCEVEEPLYANSRFLALHTATGGKRAIKLPRTYKQIRELFSNRLVAENTNQFEDVLQKSDTVLYQLED